MRLLSTAALVAPILAMAACADPPPLGPVVTRIAAYPDHTLVDGKRGGPGDIQRAVRRAAKSKGNVFLYIDPAVDTQEEMSAGAGHVVDYVKEFGVPIAFSGKPDFSDVEHFASPKEEPKP